MYSSKFWVVVNYKQTLRTYFEVMAYSRSHNFNLRFKPIKHLWHFYKAGGPQSSCHHDCY